MTQPTLPANAEHADDGSPSALSTLFGNLRSDRGLLRRIPGRVAAFVAALSLAASSLLLAQPAAAATSYPVYVTFDNVRISMVNDGCVSVPFCATDASLEIYGTVG